MLIGMVAQFTATYCMFKYKFLQDHIEEFSAHTAQVHNNDIIAVGILSMVFPCLVLLLLTVEYFLLLFWPSRLYPAWYNSAKRWLFVFCVAGTLATALASTVVVVSHSASITGVDQNTALQYTQIYFRPPLTYRTWPQNIAWIVLLWISLLPTFAR
ncbi:hypothetical protein B0H34DRAFT_733089 [Crassisporium funariophilum]|nr:hypothetical protein B0H34DRAFT_733089 [Crassisporium funariophilum]